MEVSTSQTFIQGLQKILFTSSAGQVLLRHLLLHQVTFTKLNPENPDTLTTTTLTTQATETLGSSIEGKAKSF